MKSDCCGAAMGADRLANGSYWCSKCGREQPSQPRKLTPEQEKLIRWPNMDDDVTWRTWNLNSPEEVMHWAIRYALRDLMPGDK